VVRGRRASVLPRGISRADARALLGSCDRRRLLGRRDYALIILLLRLGLRRGEAAGLTLDDIDWRAGELLVRGKGGRKDRLPLPADVGEAITAYLRRGRPASDRREVFLGARAPYAPIASGTVASAYRGYASFTRRRLRPTSDES
jgi:integrase